MRCIGTIATVNYGKPPLSPRHWPTWLAIGFGWALARAPWWLQQRLGRVIGAVFFVALPRRRTIAADNLARCFPEWSPAEREALLRENFRSLGIGVFEFLRAWWGRGVPRGAHIEFKGLERLLHAQEQGQCVILVAAHFVTLEMGAKILCDHANVAGVYRQHESPAMEWAVRRGRLRHAVEMFPRDATRSILRHLKSGGVLWFAPDQESRRGESVFVPFFDQSAWSLTSTHQLARMSGAKVMPFFHRRDRHGYTLEIGEPLADFPSNDPILDTAQVMAAIEKMIRREPAQYLWLHARFKTQPDQDGKPVRQSEV